MQKVFTKYWLAIQIGLLAVVLCCFFVFERPPVFMAILWMSVLALETALVLPSIRRGETLADARCRVVRAVWRDPFFYLGMAVLSLACVQWLNGGCHLEYLPDADTWRFSAPALTWAPSSVERVSALARFSVLTGVFTVCLCLRHAVSLSGKRSLLSALTIFSGAAAFFAVWFACRKNGPLGLGQENAQNFALGSFFAFWMILGMGVLADALAGRRKGAELLFGVGVLGNLVGMLMFCSALWMLICSGTAVLLFVYWMFYLKTQTTRSILFKPFLLSVVVVAVVFFAVCYVFPENPVAGKVKNLFDSQKYWHSLVETKTVRSAAALKVWQEHPWVGVGVNGFQHFSAAVVSDQNWRLIRNDPACVYNDGLQMLCEYGLLGTGLLVFAAVLLVAPIFYRMQIAWKFGDPNDEVERWFLLRISPIVVTGALALILCLGQGWFESPFRSSAVLTSWTVACTVLSSFLPGKANPVRR